MIRVSNLVKIFPDRKERVYAVNTTDRGTQTAERYLASVRGKRALTRIVSFTAGERAERDPLAGIDVRSILDAGLSYALVRDASSAKAIISPSASTSTGTSPFDRART